MKMKGSNTSVTQGKNDKSKKFDNNLSGTNDSKIKNSSLESSKKNTVKYPPGNVNKNPPAIKESMSTTIPPNQTAAFRRKTERIDELRKEIKEDYIRSSQRRNVISKWREVIQILQTLDIKLLLIAIKVLGDIYMEFDDYENARTLFSFYKIVSFRLELFEETMYAYESLGNVYKFL